MVLRLGQAYVFYDAPEGQARVLGGGIIASAASLSLAKPIAPVTEHAAWRAARKAAGLKAA